jgi:hypothetical protein
MKYASSLNVLHEDVLMKIFVSSLESSQRSWLAHSCKPKSIPSSTNLIEEFLRHYRPATQNLQDTFQELKDALCREGFPIDEDEENLEEDPDEVSHVEYLMRHLMKMKCLYLPFHLMKTSSLCSSCTSRREHDEL